jgi:CRP/FNR family nitrogen fixation transcriptional regulator
MLSLHTIGSEPDAIVAPRLGESPGIRPRRAVRSFLKDNVIYAEGDPADYFYRVVSGAVRSCNYLSDGRRQIAAFHVAGELFGIECTPSYRSSAEVTRTVRVAVYARFDLGIGAWGSNAEVMRTTFIDLRRAQSLAVVLGRKSAAERVASFLLDLSQRIGRTVVELPMSRADIADHLGLTLETVSRTFSQLEREKVIKLPAPKTVFLQDTEVLNQLNEGQPVGTAFE